MAKHNQQKPFVHNSKETNRNEQSENSQAPSDTRPYSRAEQATIMVEIVVDAFASLGKETKVTDYRRKRFDKASGKFIGEVRRFEVRPVNDTGHTAGLSMYGDEGNWAQSYVALKEQFSERADAVKHVAENEELLKLLA